MLNWAYPDALHDRTAVWMALAEGRITTGEARAQGIVKTCATARAASVYPPCSIARSS
jgi:hypothetical protein